MLYGTAKKFKTHWYCKSNFENTQLWAHQDFLIPPLINCLAEYLTCEFNETIQKPDSRENIKIFSNDFGGDKSIRFINKFFGYKFGPVFDKLFNTFINNGYKVKENIFGAPYDWRLNPITMDTYFFDLKNLIENAYKINNNVKVIIYSMSAGTMALHEFLTKYVTQDWKDKYISGVIFHAPSFSGAFNAFQSLWIGNIEAIPAFLDSEEMKNMIRSFPTVSAHLFKTSIYDDDIIVYGPNGETYKSIDLPELLINQNKISSNLTKIFKISSKYSKSSLLDPGVPSYFLFNTALNTPKTFIFDQGWDKEYQTIYGKGDSTILEKGLKYPCEKWNSNKGIVCQDIKIDDQQYNHGNQLQSQKIIDLLFKIIQSETWIKPGRKLIEGI